LQKRRTFADKGIAFLRPIFVPGTDQFDYCHELATPFGVVDADFVFVIIGYRRLDGDGRLGRCPGGGRGVAE
jgi:hypothetical protein